MSKEQESKTFHERAKSIAEKSLARSKGAEVQVTTPPIVASQTTNTPPPQPTLVDAPINVLSDFPDVHLNSLPNTQKSGEFDYDIDPELSAAELEAEKVKPILEAKAPEAESEDDEEFPDILEGQNSAAENFKRLRKKYKYTKEEARSAREEALAHKARLDEYESGLTVPEVTQKLNNRISQLETYEKIFNLKTTPEYIEKVTTPLNESFKTLNEYVAEYSADQGLVEAALSAETKAERNRLLARAGLDPVASLEISNTIGKIRELNVSALEMEKEPAKALDKLVSDNMYIKGEREKAQRTAIAEISKSVWIESVQDIRSQGTYPELTMVAGNTEHNDNFVKPVLQKAATEYGRLVNGLVEAGLKELPAPIGKALARMTKLAIGGAVVREQNKALQARVEELEESIKTKNSHYRPGAHGAHVASNRGAPDSSGKKESAAMRAYNRANGSK